MIVFNGPVKENLAKNFKTRKKCYGHFKIWQKTLKPEKNVMDILRPFLGIGRDNK